MRNLRLEREKRGWSQFELARRSRVNPTTISMMETGRLIPGDPRLRRLAKSLDWPEDDAARLLEEAGN